MDRWIRRRREDERARFVHQHQVLSWGTVNDVFLLTHRFYVSAVLMSS